MSPLSCRYISEVTRDVSLHVKLSNHEFRSKQVLPSVLVTHHQTAEGEDSIHLYVPVRTFSGNKIERGEL